ncbi:MAG TPA: MBL fold metallo-hydrolase [Gaiellaceae bacterium]
MFFRQVLHEDLGCASYVIANGGEAVVVDPKWEIADYLRLAAVHGLELRRVLETHTHADHVSGRARLGLEPFEGGELRVGETCIRAVEAPGHRPEHRAFLVDGRALLTGDSLFVGDVARPDLAVEPAEGARQLFATIRRLLELDDHVEVWPGHIGGSACGGAGMDEKPSSTIGRERRENPFCRIEDEDEFVRRLCAELPPQPPSFERIVELNGDGPPDGAAPLEPLAPERVRALLDGGALLLDGREPREFDARHLPGALNVSTAFSGVGTRAAWVAGLDDEVLVTDPAMVRLLEAVGFRRVLVAGTIPLAWPFETTPALDPAGLAERLRRDEVTLLDVREDGEWEEGHVAGSLHVPFHQLRDGPPGGLDGKPVAVACSAGNRSALASSLLRRHGVEDVVHVVDGGVEDLADQGVELVS